VANPPSRLDLLIPGLLHLAPSDIDLGRLRVSAPTLYKVLRFADRAPREARDFDQILASLLGEAQGGLPYARGITEGRGEPPGDAEILFRPVFLKADINNAIVFPLPDFQSDIGSIINDLEGFFKDDFTLEALPGGIWLMRLHRCRPVTRTPHYLNAVGKKVTHYLEQARGNLEWFKLFNEMQMYLHQHPLNQQRLQQGQAMANSLWCWGGDEPGPGTRRYAAWYSDDIELRDLGRLYADQVGALGDLPRQHPAGNRLAVDLRVLHSLKSGADSDPMQLLADIENSYLHDSMHAGVSMLHLYTGAAVDLHFAPRHSWRLWRSASWSFPLQ
jgi:hypothetical protein